MFKLYLKALLKKVPVAFTQNQKYDAQTRQIIKKVCNTYSNCVDVGCHKGESLDEILQFAPLGNHYCFEPLPDLYKALLQKEYPPNCHFYELGLSSDKSVTTFNYVISNPAYSGFVKRDYDHKDEIDTTIQVNTDLLDNIIPKHTKVAFIKIDVEGAELWVLKGAIQTLKTSKPVVVFEYGLGAADHYGSKPEDIFHLLTCEANMDISLLKNWLRGNPPLSLSEFKKQYFERRNYYFIAYPKASSI